MEECLATKSLRGEMMTRDLPYAAIRDDVELPFQRQDAKVHERDPYAGFTNF